MTKYSGLLKAKLQELLTARGLPVDGTKEVLIERLEESDKIAAELDEEEDTAPVVEAKVEEKPEEAVPVAAETKIEAPVVESKVEEEPKEEAKEETVSADAAPSEEKKEEEKKEDTEINPETLKIAAIEYLNKNIARAQKFGEEQQVAQFQADLARIEKFGIALDSALARTLGYAPKKPVGTPAQKNNRNGQRRPQHRQNGSNRGRGGRGGRGFIRNNSRGGNGFRRGGRGGNHHSNNGRIYKTRY